MAAPPHRLFHACFLEEVMGYGPFRKPVFLRLNQTGNYQARNAWEALEYLELHWPAPRTADYRRARAMCQSALDGLILPDSARNYLIEAAHRAGILERSWKSSTSRPRAAYPPANQNAPAPTQMAS
jgi:hypothetical protein